MGSHYEHLSAEERGTITALRSQGAGIRRIATVLHRAPSTISRELARNGEPRKRPVGAMGRPRLPYDGTRAGRQAYKHRHRRRRHKLDWQGALWATVLALLGRKWSPQQIAASLGVVSHETIYTAIYAMPRGELRREITWLLRQHRAERRPLRRGTTTHGRLPDLLSIHVRPPEANDRLLPGHWEGDFIKGGYSTAVGTLVDRHSLFLMLSKMDGCKAKDALKGFRDTFAPLPPELRKTLTYDQGKEMALHAELAKGTGLTIYFADPYSPWQRGINENTNGLIRQYLPKGEKLSHYSQRQLDEIAWSLNTRPRRSLGYRTPADVFFNGGFERKPKTVALDT